MKKITLVLLLCVLSACLAEPTPLPPTETPTITPWPTATVEWFPPTPTRAVTPTSQVLPTQAVVAELGEVIFRDEFNSPEDWTLPQTDRGQISVGNGEASIVINEPRTLLTATRERPDVTDFYAEITANPILCSAKDEYGFLFRVSGRNHYYRFAITCGGDVRLDKITALGGTILYSPTRSASVPVGAPSVSRIAVVVERDQLHLFINGDYQTTVSDSQILAGSFGIFARSSGESALTVSFKNLVVREILPK